MKIGDSIYVHGYVDEIRKDTVIIRNNGGYFGTVSSEIIAGVAVLCKECQHYIKHDKRCGFWNHGVRDIDWCCHAERAEDERTDYTDRERR